MVLRQRECNPFSIHFLNSHKSPIRLQQNGLGFYDSSLISLFDALKPKLPHVLAA